VAARGFAAGSQPRLRGVPNGTVVVGLILAGALVVGLLAAVRPMVAIGLVVAVAAMLAVVSDARMLPPFLVLSVFAEGVSVGGFNLGRVVGPVALAVVIYYVLAGGRAHLRASPLVGVALAFGAWTLASLYWSVDSHWVFVWFLKWALSIAFAVAFAVLVQREEDFSRVLGAFVIGATIFGLITVLTYVGSAGSSRAAGLTGDPNQFASYEALALAPALALAATGRWRRWRFLLYLSIPISVLAIVESFSRGGFLTLAVVVLTSLFVSWRVFFRSRAQKALYAGLLLAVGVVVVLVGSTAYQQRLGTILSGSDRGSGRTDLWSAAWRGYTMHPYTGLGAGGFEARSLTLLQTTPGVDITASYVQSGRPVHNAYFEPLVDLGPVGVALFLALVGFTFWYLVRAARTFRALGRDTLWRLTVSLTVSFVGLAMALVFLSIELGHMLWTFVGIAVAADALARRESARLSTR
jgi:hypothetical protein